MLGRARGDVPDRRRPLHAALRRDFGIDAPRIERALRSLRAAPLLAGTRTGAPVDIAAAAALAARAGALLLDQELELIELNPVLVNARGAVAVDAVVRTGAHT